jgi:hypothetical protein
VAEARTGKRFPVELPIRIHVSDSDKEQAGTTANVSAAGVFLKADTGALARTSKSKKKKEDVGQLRCGAVVEFELILPAAAIGADADVRIQCRGRVVRVEKPTRGDARDGVACVIDKYEFVRKA